MGADYVFDTDFAADLTIMEEASEFLNDCTIIRSRKCRCSPPAVRAGYASKSQYPDMVSHLSTSKSPHQMLVLLRNMVCGKADVDPSSIYNISVMPCVAKKHEIDIPVMNDSVTVMWMSF